ncbi:MAG: anti-sigma factor, partial [Bacteroidota bacterium]
KVHVFWHSTSKDVYLLIDDLPEPPKDHQYQLWAIIDGVSLDAGIFDHHTKMQKLRHIEGKVSAFAVTLEEAGGKPTPNLDRMYVKGEVKEA